MDFLDKLYSNDYFGIGLFIVIAFLVVAFLVVLFFGKKDEKKRKLEETNRLKALESTTDGFKEVSSTTPVEVPVPTVEPVNVETPVTPAIEPVAPINIPSLDNSYVENLQVEPKIEEPVVAPIAPVINPVPVAPVTPITIEEPVTPITEVINEPVNVTPVVENTTPVIEPIRINIPEEPINNEPINTPIIEETVKPIILNTIETPHLEEVPVEPTSFYHEPEKVEVKPIEVPNIDFDAIAKSISQELDDLENNSKEKASELPREEVSEPREQFSSVYVNNAAKVNTIPKTKIVLPKKIELPEVKQKEEIEPESYQI